MFINMKSSQYGVRDSACRDFNQATDQRQQDLREIYGEGERR